MAWGAFFNNISWDALSAISTAIAVFLAFPYVQKWLNRPKIKVTLLEPYPDNQNTYWLLRVENTGGVINQGAVYLTSFKEQNGEKKFMPMLRFEWPWEITSKSGDPYRAIGRSQEVDLFSTEQGGKFHHPFYPTQLPQMPKNLGESLEFAVRVIGENYYQKQEKWFRLTKTANSWTMEEL